MALPEYFLRFFFLHSPSNSRQNGWSASRRAPPDTGQHHSQCSHYRRLWGPLSMRIDLQIADEPSSEFSVSVSNLSCQIFFAVLTSYRTPPRDLEEPRLSINEENNARKCANMWRSIILSMCKDRTYLPYYEYIKSFYLGSLRDMLSRSINE